MPKFRCPNCSSSNTCRIVYGYVSAAEAVEDDTNVGEVHYGGCIVSENDPNRHCNGCDVDFDTNAPNIYLDIDGVLLTSNLKPANYAKEFIAEVLRLYPYTTYWLTTHCQGDANVPVRHIGHLFDDETVELLKQVKPTMWDTAKTRAIDFKRPFLWFDDNLFYEEMQTLDVNNVSDNWIKIDLTKNPNQLADFLESFPLPMNV